MVQLKDWWCFGLGNIAKWLIQIYVSAVTSDLLFTNCFSTKHCGWWRKAQVSGLQNHTYLSILGFNVLVFWQTFLSSTAIGWQNGQKAVTSTWPWPFHTWFGIRSSSIHCGVCWVHCYTRDDTCLTMLHWNNPWQNSYSFSLFFNQAVKKVNFHSEI